MDYLIYIIFGLSPSIIWLLFYLRKDAHPEPKRMVLKIFFYGMLIAFVAAAIEKIIEPLLNWLNSNVFSFPSLYYFLYFFIGVAFVEEFLKFFVVEESILKNPEFDEPTDIMIYMITAALGFAALENIFVLIPVKHETLTILGAASISSFRFIGATFLHALCSGTVGFFSALSILKTRKRYELILLGLTIATILHGLYNFSIMNLEKNFYFIYVLAAILIGLALFVSFGFRKLKKISSTCEEGKEEK